MDGMASLFGGYSQVWKWRTPRWNGIPARPRAREGAGYGGVVLCLETLTTRKQVPRAEKDPPFN
jgi:hypothetical protein